MVALVPSAECSPTGILPLEHRADSAFGTRHFDDKDVLALKPGCIDHLAGEDVVADLLTVVDHVPQVVFHLLRVVQTIFQAKRVVRPFFNTQQDCAAIGVGKSGISFPKRVWETSLGTLCLQVIIFSLTENV